MIINEHDDILAECDNCHLTLGVGMYATPEECRNTFRQWGWTLDGNRLLCDVCSRDPEWIERELRRIRRKRACLLNV